MQDKSVSYKQLPRYISIRNMDGGLPEKQEKQKQHFCYIIYDDFNSTYNGYTCNLKRRIRQHNGEIKGGAKFTTKRQLKTNANEHWKYMMSITSSDPIFDYKKALSLEWSIKNPTNRRTRPKRTPHGRIESLPLVFSNPKFRDISYTIFVHQKIFHEMIGIILANFTNITIVPAFDEFDQFSLPSPSLSLSSTDNILPSSM